MQGGKTFGARKSAVIRLLSRGYASERTQVMARVSDRKRLRSYCKANGGIPMVDGITRLLDSAGVGKVGTDARRSGRLDALVSALRLKSGETDDGKLIIRIRSGEFDRQIANFN